jgi:hypothetical protein
MAQFRVEFVQGKSKGRISAQLYYPPEADKPLVSTGAIYRSEVDALLAVVKMFKDAMEGGRGAARRARPRPSPRKPGGRRAAARKPARKPRGRKSAR